MNQYYYFVRVLLLLFLLMSFNIKGFTQELDTTSNKIGIFRVAASIPIPIVNLQYEIPLKKTVTLLIKSGLNFTLASSAALNRDKIRSQVSWISSIESRYYYSLNRRIRNGKSIKNYSAGYIGIEPYFRSNSIASINEPKQINNGSYGTFINLGFQNQSEKNIYTAFFIGVAPFAFRLGEMNTTTGKLDRIWLNFSIGYVF